MVKAVVRLRAKQSALRLRDTDTALEHAVREPIQYFEHLRNPVVFDQLRWKSFFEQMNIPVSASRSWSVAMSVLDLVLGLP